MPRKVARPVHRAGSVRFFLPLPAGGGSAYGGIGGNKREGEMNQTVGPKYPSGLSDTRCRAVPRTGDISDLLTDYQRLENGVIALPLTYRNRSRNSLANGHASAFPAPSPCINGAIRSSLLASRINVRSSSITFRYKAEKEAVCQPV